MSSLFDLRSSWRMPRGRDAMWQHIDALLASDDPMEWWPSVQVSNYDGSRLEVRAKSHMGYTLDFSLTDLRTQPPDRIAFRSGGDLAGRGEVVMVDLDEHHCRLDIRWRVSTERVWMRRTAWLLRPGFVLGHDLVMRQGEKHLRAWVSSLG